VTLVEAAWDDARVAAYGCGALLPTEHVQLADADRRVLADVVVANTALPAFATSAMDGWAVCGNGPWQVIGEVLAGTTRSERLRPGEAVGIATGAAIPEGSLAVLRREGGSWTDEGTLSGTVVQGQHIRPAGEEATSGHVLIEAGTVLTPAHLGLAAAGGADLLEVVAVPTAEVLVLGDELLESGFSRDGRVRDSLGPQIPGWLTRLGVRSRAVTRVEDTLAAHVSSLEGVEECQLIVTTGGTAGGPVDYLHDAIDAVGGRLVVDSVAVRPGHPMLLAQLGEHRWLLGLPGNPQSAIVALLSLGVPLLAALNGRAFPELPRTSLGEDASAPPGETRLLLCAQLGDVVMPTSHLGSAMLRGLAVSDGFAVIPPGGAPRGTSVRWLPLPP